MRHRARRGTDAAADQRALSGAASAAGNAPGNGADDAAGDRRSDDLFARRNRVGIGAGLILAIARRRLAGGSKHEAGGNPGQD